MSYTLTLVGLYVAIATTSLQVDWIFILIMEKLMNDSSAYYHILHSWTEFTNFSNIQIHSY